MTSATPVRKYKSLKSTGPKNTWARLLIITLLCLVVGQLAAAGAANAAAVTVDDVSAVEGAGLMFTVKLDDAVASPFAVDVNFTDGTATGGPDYSNAPRTLPFNGLAGEFRTFIVPTGSDTILEGDEIFTVTLKATDPLVDASDTGIGRIIDDDTAAVTVEDVTAVEGAGLMFL
jgi:hypothetical protein